MRTLKDKAPVIVLCAVMALIVVSLFKNIGYPLLWNDEGETAMFATRVLEYGYPKVNDGKNAVYLISKIPIELGTNIKTGAYLVNSWAQYYFCAAGVFLAKNIDDIYTKTAVVRIPFAFIGLAGLIVIALSVIGVFRENPAHRMAFFNAFFLLELLSVHLTLHLREVRYYPLAIFFSACVIYSYINYRFLKRGGIFSYTLLMSLSLILLLLTFPPSYSAFMGAILLYEILEYFKHKGAQYLISNTLPLVISAVAAIPVFIFFRTFVIAKFLAATFINVDFALYYKHVAEMLLYFAKYEYLGLALILKLTLVVLWFYFRKSNPIRSWREWPSLETGLKISNFLSLFFIIQTLVIAKIPLYYIYQRYYINMQPILIVILLLDIFTVFKILSPCFTGRQIRAMFPLIITLLLLNSSYKIEPAKQHIYELFHQYRGPLDFVIPYIKSNYRNTEKLIIATNYEECVYMYYLGCKTIVGFAHNNIKEDLNLRPDILVPRKRPDAVAISAFDYFLKKARYEKVSFPVYDYPVNNIPEIDDPFHPHLYKTKMAEGEGERLEIYIKK